MLYGLVSQMDDETSKVLFRSKKVSKDNLYYACNLAQLANVLKSGDTVYTVSCTRFASVNQVYQFAKFCSEHGVNLRFIAEPYLDIGSGKTWRASVARLVKSMAESEYKAKSMMYKGFKMVDAQWEYAYRCFEMMNLDILAHTFASDGVLHRGS